MASHQEIEVKLRTDPAKIAKIRRSPWWRGLERLQRQSLHSIYYDTSDHRLRDCHISLRTRTDGHSFVQTLKMPNGRIGLGRPHRVGDDGSGPDSRSYPGHRSGVAGRFPQAHLRGPAAGVRRGGQAGNPPPGIGWRADRRLAGPGRRDLGRGTRAHSRDRAGTGVRRSAGTVRGGAAHRRSGRRALAYANQGGHRLCARRRRTPALVAGIETQPDTGDDGARIRCASSCSIRSRI